MPQKTTRKHQCFYRHHPKHDLWLTYDRKSQLLTISLNNENQIYKLHQKSQDKLRLWSIYESTAYEIDIEEALKAPDTDRCDWNAARRYAVRILRDEGVI